MATPFRMIRRAQSEQLFGFAGELEDVYSPYQGGTRSLGDTSLPYDLNAPGAVAEIKNALRGIAALQSQKEVVVGPVKVASVDPVQETVWQQMGSDDTWNLATALEFVFFATRNGLDKQFPAQPPYFVDGKYPSGPQPTVSGLELLASAVNTLLSDSSSKLKIYEAWRGGVFSPPSFVSQPSSDAKVVQTANFRPTTFLPADASAASKQALADADNKVAFSWKAAAASKDESQRVAVAKQLTDAATEREKVISDASMTTPSLKTAEQNCIESGGTWNAAKQTCIIQREPPPPDNKNTPPARAEESNTMLWVLGGLAIVGVAGALVYRSNRRGR